MRITQRIETLSKEQNSKFHESKLRNQKKKKKKKLRENKEKKKEKCFELEALVLFIPMTKGCLGALESVMAEKLEEEER